MRPSLRSAAASTLLLAALSAPASAQDLSYTETTRMEMGGMMGAMMSMMGDLGEEHTERVYVQGTQMRRDGPDGSTIMDFSTGEIIMLDHEERSFMRVDLREMTERMAARMDSAAGEMESARAEREARGEATPEFDVRFSTDRTGTTETIDGYEAEQVLMVAEFEGEMDPEEPGPFAGMRMAMVTELWVSTDFPGWDRMQELQEELRDAWGEGGMGGDPSGAAMGAMPGMGERLQAAMREQSEALAELEGTPVRTVMSWVTLGPDAELDPRAVVEQEVGGGSAAGGAADAARSALSGLFGRRGGGEEEAPAAPVVMRTVTEVRDAETGPVDSSLFQVPEGYTERAAPGMGG